MYYSILKKIFHSCLRTIRIILINSPIITSSNNVVAALVEYDPTGSQVSFLSSSVMVRFVIDWIDGAEYRLV